MIKTNERDNIKIISLEYKSLYEIDENIKITPSLAIMINDYCNNKSIIEHNNYEYRKLRYLNRKEELSLKKQYNKLIENLYQTGQIIINNEQCLLKDFYILYQDGINKYYLSYIKSPYNDFIRKSSDVFPYNNAIKFIDSTAFITLINDPSININENIITVDNNNVLLDILDNWDGLLHNKIWFTESINNKKMLRDD